MLLVGRTVDWRQSGDLFDLRWRGFHHRRVAGVQYAAFERGRQAGNVVEHIFAEQRRDGVHADARTAGCTVRD